MCLIDVSFEAATSLATAVRTSSMGEIELGGVDCPLAGDGALIPISQAAMQMAVAVRPRPRNRLIP